MTIAEKINADMVAALKARAELRLSTLRMMKAAVKNREIEARSSLADADVIRVLATLIKQREDSAAQFDQGGRPELAQKERAEILIIEEYLPRALSLQEVEAVVVAAIAETGARSPKDLGAVMKAAMAKFQAANQRVEGKLVSDAARRLLAG